MRIIVLMISMVGGSWLVANVAWSDPMISVPASGGLVQCQTDLMSCDTALDTCTMNLTTCDSTLGTCTTDLTTCDTDLTTCDNDLETCVATASSFPATGQTHCWDSSGMLIDCAGTGHDGEIQAGSELPYIDTGLTIIDDNTRLEWSKQDYNVGGGCDSYPGNLSINCFFNWDEAFEFVATLNANAYAGHTDWRLPNVKELFSLLRFDGIPMISDAFDNECTVGCTVETCSCLAGEYYSSTTYQLEPYDPFITSPSHANEAYIVNLINSNVTTSVKTENRQARAVRGGL